MGVQHNAGQVGGKLVQADQRIREELQRTLGGLAGRVTALMRQKAPKSARSTLANSIDDQERGPFEWFVGPGEAYGVNVEDGRKPGKGLPRFFDPASASIVAWLRGRIATVNRAANAKWRPGRLGSKRRTQDELELRDRYMALSRHVKLRGIKASPYVKPTAEEFRQPAADALVQAVRAGAQRAGLNLRGRT